MRLFPEAPPPVPPFRDGSFTSPLRSRRAATRIGIWLAVCVLLAFLTGLFSHLQQNPVAWLPIPPSPAWGYRLSQGIHVAAGLAAIPLALWKLWLVYPRLFEWPPFRSVAHLVERLAVFLLVATLIFQLSSGTSNIAQWYPWPFGFVPVHYAMSFVLIGALLIHLGVKAPQIMAALRSGRDDPPDIDEQLIDEQLVDDQLEGERPEADEQPAGVEQSGMAGPSGGAGQPVRAGTGEGGLSRRGLFVAGGLAVGAVTLTTIGQTLRPLEKLALLAPRRPSVGPQSFPVTKSAASARITPAATGPEYRLRLLGTERIELTLAELNDLPQTEVELPIACVEGWSATATWSGILVSDLAAMMGAPEGATIRVSSIEEGGLYSVSELPEQFVTSPLTILALRINGEVLHIDHGYPARIIAPNRPGVLQTKWVTTMEVI